MKRNNRKYQSKQGFKTPDGYFDSLEDRILNTVAAESLKTKKSLEETGFAVPENYFEGLEDRILQNVKNPAKSSKIIPLFKRRKFIYAATAAAIVIAFISTLFLQNLPVTSLDNMELSALENYIEEGYIDFNLVEISSFMYEEGFMPDNFNSTDFNREAVYEYLDENLEDPAYIIE